MPFAKGEFLAAWLAGLKPAFDLQSFVCFVGVGLFAGECVTRRRPRAKHVRCHSD